MQKDLDIAPLIDCYGELLTEKQLSLIEHYYFDDLSLSEIADNEGITRQGVRDAVRHAEAQLRAYEDTLHFAQRTDELRSAIKLIREIACRIPDGCAEQAAGIIALCDSVIED